MGHDSGRCAGQHHHEVITAAPPADSLWAPEIAALQTVVGLAWLLANIIGGIIGWSDRTLAWVNLGFLAELHYVLLALVLIGNHRQHRHMAQLATKTAQILRLARTPGSKKRRP